MFGLVWSSGRLVVWSGQVVVCAALVWHGLVLSGLVFSAVRLTRGDQAKAIRQGGFGLSCELLKRSKRCWPP